jgi:hypothetical protein
MNIKRHTAATFLILLLLPLLLPVLLFRLAMPCFPSVSLSVALLWNMIHVVLFFSEHERLIGWYCFV